MRVISTEPQGIVKALNIGISECASELIARMDADDVSHPSRLRLQMEMMNSDSTLSVCGCSVRFFPRNKLLGGLLRYEEWMNSLILHDDIARDLFIESPMPHPGVMLRTAELKKLGGYEEHGWPEDYDLWLRYHLAGKKFGKIARPLIFQRTGPERLTFTDSRYSVENFLRAKAHYLAKLLLPQERNIALWGAGMTGRRLSKHLKREGLKIDAVIDVDPHKIGHTMHGLPIVSPDYLIGKGAFVISAVSSHNARQLIREYMNSIGSCEGCDFICAA